MTQQPANRHQWRIEMAHTIFLACNGNMDKAMKHKKMPYQRRSTVLRLAKKNKWYENAGIPKPKFNGLTEEEIERIHIAFIEADGYLGEVSQRTGFARSTISRYAKSKGWHEELLKISRNLINQRSEGKNSINERPVLDADDSHIKCEVKHEDREEITMKMKTLRQMLFHEIIKDENTEAINKTSLKIIPKTLSEAIKALIDIDKRISEREGITQDTILNPYQNIIENCGRTIEDEQEP